MRVSYLSLTLTIVVVIAIIYAPETEAKAWADADAEAGLGFLAKIMGKVGMRMIKKLVPEAAKVAVDQLSQQQ
uniref:U10-myrmicitoxin-Tb1a n=1 Tax=Tetramorium bicarinatum TaxID=219812 RepID=TX10A_TETBN|nr:U10-MYRTX-Tb1a precursor [Tetramorium bicarinatum]